MARIPVLAYFTSVCELIKSEVACWIAAVNHSFGIGFIPLDISDHDWALLASAWFFLSTKFSELHVILFSIKSPVTLKFSVTPTILIFVENLTVH